MNFLKFRENAKSNRERYLKENNITKEEWEEWVKKEYDRNYPVDNLNEKSNDLKK